jgi:hypothetical protein
LLEVKELRKIFYGWFLSRFFISCALADRFKVNLSGHCCVEWSGWLKGIRDKRKNLRRIIMKTKMKLLASSAIIMSTFGLSNVSWSYQNERDSSFPRVSPAARPVEELRMVNPRLNRDMVLYNGNGENRVAVRAERERPLDLMQQGQGAFNQLMTMASQEAERSGCRIAEISGTCSPGFYKVSGTSNRRREQQHSRSDEDNRQSSRTHEDRSRRDQGHSAGTRGITIPCLFGGGVLLGGGDSSSNDHSRTDIQNRTQSSAISAHRENHVDIDTNNDAHSLELSLPIVTSFNIKFADINQQPEQMHLPSTPPVRENGFQQSGIGDSQGAESNQGHRYVSAGADPSSSSSSRRGPISPIAAAAEEATPEDLALQKALYDTFSKEDKGQAGSFGIDRGFGGSQSRQSAPVEEFTKEEIEFQRVLQELEESYYQYVLHHASQRVATQNRPGGSPASQVAAVDELKQEDIELQRVLIENSSANRRR